MLFRNLIDLQGNCGFSGLFFASGSFGILDGDCNYTYEEKGQDKIYRYFNGTIELVASFTEKQNGVIVRKDCFRNISNEAIELNSIFSRFCLDGNDYEVYTQFNGWQHESNGNWQKLVTCVTAESQGIRTCDGATPIMALHNCYNSKNMVFHLLPNAQWKISARKVPYLEKEVVVLETGFNDSGLRMSVLPGEKIELPTIIFFSAESKTDLDAYKLHRIFNDLYPRKALPILYNPWLYCYDNLNADDLLEQIDAAAELGIEAFMIDAGWFGVGEDWNSCVGDWRENMSGRLKGRLKELSDRVREKGMIFGLWFEPERASANSETLKSHPEFYINGTFFDFSNQDAIMYMFDIISSQIEKYNIGWLKLDFNTTTPLDLTGCAFYRYMQGQRKFISLIREKYPDIYITNCASGGYRMELEQATMFDSFWLSDNQGSYVGIDIVKNTLKRMPTSLIERWNVQKFCDGFISYGNRQKVGKMLTCNDATWESVVSVDDSFTQAFLTGGPVGFSCDISNIPEEYKTKWKNFILEYKHNREFYISAAAKVLVDNNDVVVIQYMNEDLSKNVIHVFVKNANIKNLVIYPEVNPCFMYKYNNESILGNDISQSGVMMCELKNNYSHIFELNKQKLL